MDMMNFARTYWDRIAAAVSTIAGVVSLVLGWQGVSDTPYPAAQIPYVVSNGLGGLFLLGLAALLWLSADLRDEWSKLDSLDQRLDRLIDLTEEQRDTTFSAGHQDAPRRSARPAARATAEDQA